MGESAGSSRAPARVDHDRYIALTRATLDEGAFAAAWAAGHALPREQVLAEASGGARS